MAPLIANKTWDAWFLNSSKSNTRLKFMKLGMLSWSGINMPCYKFCPIWSRFGYMLLTNQSFSQQPWWFRLGMPQLWGRNDIHCLLLISKFFSCQHRTNGVLCYFLLFFGVRLDIFLTNWVFNAFTCIIQIWTTCTCSSAYKLVEKSNLCPWVHA